VNRKVIGIDFGTLSGRVLVVSVEDGEELGSAAFDYPHGVMDQELAVSGGKLPPNWALQDADDYVEVLKHAVPAAIASAEASPGDIVAIGIDFTSCTVLPVTHKGEPLSRKPEFRENPHAYVKLWKHHAAQTQADRINQVAQERGEAWLGRYGGQLSSEWQLAKGLQILEEAPDVYRAMFRLVEAADWIVWQMTGTYLRNACAAGYKGALQEGEYPSPNFLSSVNPDFAQFANDKLAGDIGLLGEVAGFLTAEAADWMGLAPGIVVAVGNVDAHVTAVAAQATQPGQMVAIMGTSTCHVMSAETIADVPGMCGVVDGGIVQGLYGYEAGQSGVGDIFGWFVENQVPGHYVAGAKSLGMDIHRYLTLLASRQRVGQHGLVALDWHSGNRSILVNHALSGLLIGMTLATRPEEIYRALLESTAFGTRKIIETFSANGVPVTELVVAGGLLKNEFLMQIYSDVTRLPLSTIASEQGPALGSAIHAAVAAGEYPDIKAASAKMGKRQVATYTPQEEASAVYDRLYREYELLHDYMGAGGNKVMERLTRLREEIFDA
jgi:L-ribulokinase